MRCRRASDGQVVAFHSAVAIGYGGEAVIYVVQQDPSLLAKVYHQPTAGRERKLRAMLANPPDDPMRAQGHASIAWPLDLLIGEFSPSVIGFLMPRVSEVHPIIDFYNPGTRRLVCPLFSYRYLHRAGRNLAAAFSSLHERGIVIGDVNESNILVSERALVTLVDTDSFQVPDPETGQPHRCPVGKAEFTPPEIQGARFATVDRLPEHDRFGLAVLLFQLLMEGVHPFAGRYRGRGDPPLYESRIVAGHFPYGTHSPLYQPARGALPFDTVAPALRAMFLQCFEQGHTDPHARPDADAWLDALDCAEADLRTCRANEQHWFGSHLTSCPWCQRTQLLAGRDPFPSAAEATQPPRPIRPAPVRSRRFTAPRVRVLHGMPQPPAPRLSRRWPLVAIWRGVPIGLAIVVLAGLGVLVLGPDRDATDRPAPVGAAARHSVAPEDARYLQSKAARTPPEKEDPAPGAQTVRVRLQAEAAKALGMPVEMTVELGGGLCLDLVFIPPGSFNMGSDEGRPDEAPVRAVTFARPFYMGKTEVTQRQWEAIMRANPSRFPGPSRPVENVHWTACQEFIRRLNAKTGRWFTFPSEAEWEYACRAGSTSAFCFPAHEALLADYAWHGGDLDGQTQGAAGKKPNAWGLYDMHGNVAEWCEDVYHDSYDGAPSDGTPWLTEGGLGRLRVLRGGSWYSSAWSCRSSSREPFADSRMSDTKGLRVCLRVPAPEKAELARGGPAEEARQRQADAANVLGKPVATAVELGGGVKLDLVLVPAGSFRMGSEKGAADERPVREVKIARPFYIGKYEVTLEQWRAVTGSSPSRPGGGEPKQPVEPPEPDPWEVPWPGLPEGAVRGRPNEFLVPVVPKELDLPEGPGPGKAPVPGPAAKGQVEAPAPIPAEDLKCPVEGVSWEMAQGFLEQLRAKTKRRFDLPSEAEWEYAGRAGSTTEFCFGDDPEDGLADYAWHLDVSGGKLHPVGTKRANAWGIFDMHGNAWEWCEDAWHADYTGAPSDGSAWTEGGDRRSGVIRGGSAGRGAMPCRSAARDSQDRQTAALLHGLRVVLRDF
ncbi:MAG: hypothetical protein FJ290_07605 [Planctomycetes bacterium]|nr:hypothetical protein [Planctomycetota bacterium]